MSNKKLFGTEHQTALAQSNCNNESDSSKGDKISPKSRYPTETKLSKGKHMRKLYKGWH